MFNLPLHKHAVNGALFSVNTEIYYGYGAKEGGLSLYRDKPLLFDTYPPHGLRYLNTEI